ncbi:hypothetical protein LTR56_008714 [Elasticomyces elasticus]|uniref:Uncharacterized protein n=1 Tax=Elasticomyces elasticus TaxID=574655 RepID=A0AAN7W5H9_9PEZI|nr:hypothetical protein LTR22_018266 [Elasticomyces elasticus]KAK3646097.1 hypothetical protein LTR56_008714 [Elasticomyces elasticus]KAK4924278.1 hypothetical protein LTR49_008578 [Elasticomyces elasticus]KAK5694646.1 hypothetical protein LTR97_009236 [Elasticomyces elasticus]KAK5728387.1 hypothetical protein LTR15_001523 [Elasticomyces elasticus]
MGDCLHDLMFASLKAEAENTAKSTTNKPLDDQQATHKADEIGPNPEQQQQQPKQVDDQEGGGDTDSEQHAGDVGKPAVRGTKPKGKAKKGVKPKVEEDLEHPPGWLEAAQSMGAPWYPYT